MEAVHKLENTMTSWYKKAPHLPKGGRDWIATNAWWIVLIGVILGSLAVVSMLATLMLGTALLGGAFGVFGLAAGAAITTTVLISVAGSIATLVVNAMAVQPLKAMRRRGWDLLFISYLIYVAMAALSFVLGWNFGSLLRDAVGAAIGGYFLFEVRSHFAVK